MISYPNCKINIGLRVLNKRQDGYHNIETAFYPVPLKEVLEIIPSPNQKKKVEYFSDGLIVRGDASSNLVIKAYNLLDKEFGLAPVQIFLYKNIPMGAGLGGGSADAAFALKLLNKIFELGLNNQELKKYALELGSDCPFFIDNTGSLASGRGEVLDKLELDLTGYFLVIVKPEIHVSTALAYSEVNIIERIEKELSLKSMLALPLDSWKENVINHFEESVFKRQPVISQIKSELYKSGAIYSSMSGSGSSVYALFKQEVDLRSKFEKYFYFSSFL